MCYQRRQSTSTWFNVIAMLTTLVRRCEWNFIYRKLRWRRISPARFFFYILLLSWLTTWRTWVCVWVAATDVESLCVLVLFDEAQRINRLIISSRDAWLMFWSKPWEGRTTGHATTAAACQSLLIYCCRRNFFCCARYCAPLMYRGVNHEMDMPPLPNAIFLRMCISFAATCWWPTT